MGKQKASVRDGSSAWAPTTATTSSKAASTAASTAQAPSSADEGLSVVEAAGWARVRRSFIGLMVISLLVSSDFHTWKEGATIAAPDSAPLLAMVAIFGVTVWRRWTSSSKQGLHPIYRVIGFSLMLTVFAALLPFNSTVTMYEVPLLTANECVTVAGAAEAALALPDYVPTCTHFSGETEVPLVDLSEEVSTIVKDALRERLLPFLRVQFRLEGTVVMSEGGIYIEHHEAYQERPPFAHIHERQLVFRVELTPPEEYVGGGVKLASMGRSVQLATGSALVLPAKLRHGSYELESGTRNVLVGTLSVKPESGWQRVVSMWRLWGLLSRRVKYVANRGMRGTTREEPAILPERGLDADGNDPFEF